MDLKLTLEEHALSSEIRRSLQEKLLRRPPAKAAATNKSPGRTELAERHAILNAHSWLANH